jgi:hypothetical protein
MAFRFEDLKVWRLSADLSNEVDLIARRFPKIELFSLCSQIKRAAEFKRFFVIALRSAIEVAAVYTFPNNATILHRKNIKIYTINMK